jgi:hypothetical protein
MPDWLLLLPLLFPLFGALAGTPIPFKRAISARQWFAPCFITIEIALVLVNAAPGTHHLSISSWGLASFAVALQMDGITQLLLLTMLVPLAAVWLVAPPRQPDAFPTLVLTAAILLAAADGVVAVLIAWTLLDLTVFAWRLARDIERATALRSLAIGSFAGMIFLGGAILLPAHPAEGAMLIGLALWARLGLFPFHPLLPARGAGEYDLWFARGIPILAAANLWLHWSALRVAAPYPLVGVLAGATCIVAAIWVWRTSDAPHALGIGASSALALVPLSIAYGGNAGTALALWQVLAIAFALALGDLAQRWHAENRNHYPRLVWFLGLLTLAGLPLTPAFLGRLGLYVALIDSGEWLLLILAGLSTLMILTPLWNLGLAIRGSEARMPTRVEYAGLTLALLAFTALAFAPMLITSALGPGVAESADRALERVVRIANLPSVIVGILVLVLPVAGSLVLRLLVRAYRPGTRSFAVRLARATELEWLERGLSHIGFQVGTIARSVLTLTEENPTVWILFVSLWVAIFIAIAR